MKIQDNVKRLLILLLPFVLLTVTHATVATQSSTGYGGNASRAIDGNTNGVYGNSSVTHTAGFTSYDWLLIDLESVQNINTITLWNRTDTCCDWRLGNVRIMASPTPFSPSTTATGLQNARNLAVWEGRVQSNTRGVASIPFNLGGVQARYILIQKTGSGNNSPFLSLAEVQVSVTLPPMGTFATKYTSNLKGNLKVIGNTVLRFNGNINGASNAQLALSYVNIDNTGGNFNSSSATINSTEAGVDISNARIKWAGLYWQGYLHNDTADVGIDSQFNFSTNQATANTQIPTYIQNQNILLKVGNGTYTSISPTEIGIDRQVNRTNYVSYKYAAFANVTTLLQGSSPSNIYTVANVPTRSGRTGCNTNASGFCINTPGNQYDGLGNYGAWSLVVVYDNNASPLEKTRNITVFDGYTVLSAANNPSKTIALSGFKTPKNAPNGVDSTLSIFAGEGDRNILGDFARLTNQDGNTFNLPDTSSAGSYFASVIEGVPNRNPVILNNNGIDIHTTQVGTSGGNDAGRIKTNQTSASVTLGTTQDTFMPSMIAFATELFTPKLCYDYDVRIGDHIKIPSDNRTIETNTWDDDLTLTLLIRSQISDFPIGNTKLNVTFSPNTLLYVHNSSKVSAPDTNVYTPLNDIDSSKGQIGIGRGSQALLESNGGTIGAYETVFAKQRFSFGALSHYKGSFDITISGTIQFDPNAQPVPYTLSTGAPKNSPNYIEPCGRNPIYDPIWANFNIERTDSDNYTDPKEKYPLYTQIAGKPFSVSIVSYTKDSNGKYTIPLDTNASVELEIIDASIFDNNSSSGYDSTCSEPTAQAQGAFINFSKNGQNRNRIDVNIPADIPNFNNDIALQSAAFRLWIISVKDTNGTKRIIPHSCKLDGSTPGCFKRLYQNDISAYDSNTSLGIHCQTACNSTSTDQICYSCLRDYFATPICSRDNFSIRPESFRIKITDSNETNNTAGIPLTVNDQTSGKLNANIALASGYNYRADINVTLFNDTGKAKAYHNENFKAESNLTTLGSKTDNNTIAALEFKDKTTCNDQTHRSYRLRFQNGSLDKDTYISHNNTGNYRFWILDSNWTNVDQANYPNKTRFGDCVVNDVRDECTDCDKSNPSSSSRNGDSKLGCVINSNVDNDGKYVELPLRFEPYQFGLNTVQFKQVPNRSILFMNDFNNTYYGSVLSSKLSMSTTFDGNVTAQAKGGSVTNNFTSGCSASDVTLDIQRLMHPTESYLLTSNVKFQQYLEVGLNVVDKKEGNSTTLTLPKSAFEDNYRGHAPIKLHTTIKKPYGFGNKVNPVQVNYKALIAKGYDANSSANMGTHIPDGNLTVDQNITYVYGKVTPEKRLYDNVEESYKNTSLSVDIFCDESEPGLNPNDCKNLFNLDKISKGTEEKEGGWKQATIFANNELGTTDLTASHLAEQNADPYVSADVGAKSKTINDIPFNDNNATQNDINVSVAGSARNSMVKVKFDPVPWLIYDPEHDYYRVHFIGPSAWAGVGKTGHVTDSESSDTQNNRMRW
jgi:hypothetical protein